MPPVDEMFSTPKSTKGMTAQYLSHGLGVHLHSDCGGLKMSTCSLVVPSSKVELNSQPPLE